MAEKYDIRGDVLAQGINTVVRVSFDPSGTDPQKIGFVETFSIRANINVQRAECIGELLPVSLDPTSVSVTVSMSGFIPRKEILEKGISVPGGGGFSIKNLNPNVLKLINTESITKIPYLDLYDEKTATVIGSSTWLVPTSYQDGGQGKGYVKADISLEGIGYDNGDYQSMI